MTDKVISSTTEEKKGNWTTCSILSLPSLPHIIALPISEWHNHLNEKANRKRTQDLLKGDARNTYVIYRIITDFLTKVCLIIFTFAA